MAELDITKFFISLFKQHGEMPKVWEKALADQGLRFNGEELVEIEQEPVNTEDSQEKDLQQNQEKLFLYHTPSASLWPCREEHYMLVEMDCARLLRLLRKRFSSLPEREVQLHLSYLEGVFEGSAMRRQQKIEQQTDNDIVSRMKEVKCE